MAAEDVAPSFQSIARHALSDATRSALPLGWDYPWRELPDAFAIEAIVEVTGVEPGESSRLGNRGWGLVSHLVHPFLWDFADTELDRETESACRSVAVAAEEKYKAALAEGADEYEAEERAEAAAAEVAELLQAARYEALRSRLRQIARKRVREFCRSAWRAPLTALSPPPVQPVAPRMRLWSPARRGRLPRAAGRRTRTASRGSPARPADEPHPSERRCVVREGAT